MADAFEGGLNRTLPVAPWMAPHTSRLPGTVPISPADWLFRDEVFADRMALRDRLKAEGASRDPVESAVAQAPRTSGGCSKH